MKTLKEKVEDKLIKQDQSLQTVHMLCRPRPNSNELNRVAIGYKNPLRLIRAKQVQPALYNGHEIIKNNHTPTIVHNFEDTLEIAETTRKKMNDKMNDPECVTRKRITPTGLTDKERGFEQTKACYLQEVIPLFKTLKDNFEGIQKALTKEVKEIKVVFEELEAEDAQYAVDRKRDAIELKNLLIGNNPPTPDKDTPDFDSVFIIGKMQASLQGKDNTTDSQITKLTDQVTHLQAQNDMFRAENDKIKQHYKELYDSIKITRAKHIKQVTKLTTENVNLKTRVSKDTVNPQVSARDKHAIDVEPVVSRLRNNKDAHLDYLRHLKESFETIRDIVEEAKVKTNVPVPPSTGVNSCPNASGSQPKSHVKSNRISPAKGVNKLTVEDQIMTNKPHLRTSNHVDSNKMADLNAPPDHTPAMAPPLRADDQILPHIRCQLDEQWFVLTKETLREALHITLVNNNQAFAAPPLIDGLINFINQLGYPKLVRNLSNVVTNDLFQSWRALLTIINLCLTRKTSGFERPRAPRRHRFNPRPDSPLHLANEEPVLGYLKFNAKGTKREVFRMPIPVGIQDSPASKPTQPARKPKTTAPKAPSRPSVSIPVRSAQL
nr:hypothetical protein [Tanacetum cinerariifolium]